MQAFAPLIAFFGGINSLAQRLLMMASPGNPDIYQGMDLWDFSLVDPDNRRPVDYERRRRVLQELDRRVEAGDLPALCAELLGSFPDGRIKLWTTMQALRARREHRELFHLGGYTPLYALGAKREHVVAFAREHSGQVAIVAVPRLSYTLAAGSVRPPLGELWEDLELPVPPQSAEFLDSVFTGEKIRVTGERTLLGREIFAHFPVALLVCG
jgi:(1->4)-alpha-D-glucan 1-alpha-D-glucosylmutase